MRVSSSMPTQVERMRKILPLTVSRGQIKGQPHPRATGKEAGRRPLTGSLSLTIGRGYDQRADLTNRFTEPPTAILGSERENDERLALARE
jgi:hypothetical protein